MPLPSGSVTSSPYGMQGDQTQGFTVRVSDKAFTYLGFLGGWDSLSATIRHNAVSTADLTIRTDHPRVPQLLVSGARLVIDYNGSFLMSGRIDTREAAANAGTPTMTFHLVDDFQYFSLILGWPNPERPIDEQIYGVDGDGDDPFEPGYQKPFWRSAGLASNVVKYILGRNATRLGLNLMTYGASDDLGDWIHIRSRMDTLADTLITKVDQANLGVRIGGYGTDGNLAVRFYTPTVRDHILTVDSGVVVDWSWTQSESTVTRVVIGGAGEGTGREYQTFTHDAREALLGTIKEVFVDARDIGDDYEAAISDIAVKLAEHTRAFKAAQVQRLIRQKSYDALNLAINLRDDAEWRRDHATNPSAEYTQALDEVTRYTNGVATAEDTYDEDNTTYTNLSNEEAVAYDAWLAAIDLRDERKVSFDAEMADKAVEVFKEGGTQYGLSLTLAETDSFRYGYLGDDATVSTFLVGDTVTLAIDPGVSITDVVREVTITDTAEAGLIVSPTVGNQDSMSSPNRMLVATLAKLRKTVRKMQTSR